MNANQQSALAALRSVSPIAARLEHSPEGEDRAADILELWQGTETGLRALMGGSSLGGQALIRELRQKELISLGQAYALLEFLGARDRANRTTYRATDNDVAVAREGFRQLESGLSSGVLADSAPPLAPPPPPSPYAPPSSSSYAPPATGASGYTAASGYAAGTPAPPPATPDYSTGAEPTYTARPSRIPANLWFIVLIALVIIGAVGGYALMSNRGNPTKVMDQAITMMQSGRREAARGEFQRVVRENPNLATPHVFLARLAREDGDVNTAKRELETAIRLESNNAVALREMGLILFSTGDYELARRFFVRAIQANPKDVASQGYLGCALARLNRIDEAAKFINRAGPGVWSSCIQQRPL
jgi:tetratricopeptide (TPR) repeat protein